jgi:predicted kinase
MRFIVLTGLPGTGKSQIAEALGRALAIPVFAKDWLEAALVRSGMGVNDARPVPLGAIGYELLTTLAQRQLTLGQSVILDSVASTTTIRDHWRTLATTYGARWYVIECICSDVVLHQARLAGRQRQIPGWPELEWAEVERVAARYAPWHEPRLTLDAVNPLAMNVALALAFVNGDSIP